MQRFKSSQQQQSQLPALFPRDIPDTEDVGISHMLGDPRDLLAQLAKAPTLSRHHESYGVCGAVASLVGVAGLHHWMQRGDAAAPGGRCLCLGMGGGSVPMFLSHHFPKLQVSACLRVCTSALPPPPPPPPRARARVLALRARLTYPAILLGANRHPSTPTHLLRTTSSPVSVSLCPVIAPLCRAAPLARIKRTPSFLSSVPLNFITRVPVRRGSAKN